MKGKEGEEREFDREDPLLGLSPEELSGPKMSRRTMLKLMAATGVSLSSFWGAGSFANAQAGGGHLKGGWLTDQITTLDPAQIDQILQFQIASNVYNGLVHVDEKLVPRGDLARDWEVSSDGKEWTFFLREGVKFHNGMEFDADDVLFTYNRSKDPERSRHYTVLSNVEKLEKLGKYEVKFTLKAPSAAFLIKVLERTSARAMTIVNKEALEEKGPTEYGLMPIGTGAFKVTEHRLGERLVLEKFEDYFVEGQPKLDKVTYFPIPEPATLVSAIEAGDVHICDDIPDQFVPKLKANPNVDVLVGPGPGFQAVFLNPHREPFTDRNVRLALGKAVDRKELVRKALFGLGIPAYGPIPPAQKAFFEELGDESAQAFDPEGAKKLLEEAGYPDGFRTSLICTPATKRRNQIVANMLEQNAGLEVELKVMDWTVLIDHFDHIDFDMLQIGSGADLDPNDSLIDWFQTNSKFNGPKRPDSMPYGFYSNPEVDELIQEQRVTIDREKRVELVRELNRKISSDPAAIFLFHPTDDLALNKKVKGFKFIPGLRDLHSVYLD